MFRGTEGPARAAGRLVEDVLEPQTLSMYLSVYLSIYIYIYLSIYIYIHIFISISISIFLSIYLSIYLYIYISRGTEGPAGAAGRLVADVLDRRALPGVGWVSGCRVVG